MGVMYQVIGTAIICFVSMNTGVMITWPASTIVMFSSNDTVLNRPMTETEISLVSSLSSVGYIISTVVAGFLLDKLGRKKCTVIIVMSLVLTWTVLAAYKRVEVVLICTFFSGISVAIFLVGVNYISEICQDSIRGTMTATALVAYNAGMMLLYLLGGYLTYDVLLYVGLTMNVISLALLFFLKDSPMYLMSIGKEKEAAQSIGFYRRLKITDKQVIKEIKVLKSALNPVLDESTTESETLNPDSESKKEKVSFWQFMKKSESSRQALLILNVVSIFALLQGLTAVMMYTESLFSEAIPSIPPMTCSVLMAATVIIAGAFSASLSDIVGRRPLLIYGSTATGICCVILGTQMQFHWGPSWITAVLLYVYPVTYTIGADTIPLVVVSEVFLPEVRGILSMICLEGILLWGGVSLYVIYPLLNAIGWGPVYYIFAIMSFITASICYFFLPETKGLTVEEIQPLFQKKKNRNYIKGSIQT